MPQFTPVLPPRRRKPRLLVQALISLGLTVVIILGLLTWTTLIGALRSTGPTATMAYENDCIRFHFPAEFERQGDNVTHVDLGGGQLSEREAWNIFDEERFGGVATIAYRLSATGERNEMPYDDRVAAMETAIEDIAGRPPAWMADLHTTVAHGCAGDFALLQAPSIVGRDGIVGLQYAYECTSFSGPVKGVTMTSTINMVRFTSSQSTH